jgi:quercetin dioxygenase-like cupin family protein
MEYKLFLLCKDNELLQYEIGRDGHAREARKYTDRDFPDFFPTARIKMANGNILSGYDAQGQKNGQLIFDSTNDSLIQYHGDPENAIEGMRILVTEQVEEVFRNDADSDYTDFFVIENTVYGIAGDHVDRLIPKTNQEDTVTSQRVITIKGSQLFAAAVSHWKEIFISDTKNNRILRLSPSDDTLQLNGEIIENRMVAPRGIVFSPDGILFVISGQEKNNSILQYSFRCYEQFNINDDTRADVWVVEPCRGYDLGMVEMHDLTLARRSSLIFSEKIQPLARMQEAKAGKGHHGISSSTYVNCLEIPDYFSEKVNSEAAIIALVEYEPGGHTEVHAHSDMEQAFYILEGKALFEMGEMEREAGPGELIFFPRFVKHSYKVIGDKPIKFLMLEWRNLK